MELIYLFVFYSHKNRQICEKQRGSSLTTLLTGHKCIKHSILADILPHKLMPILLSECTRIHVLTPENQKIKTFLKSSQNLPRPPQWEGCSPSRTLPRADQRSARQRPAAAAAGPQTTTLSTSPSTFFLIENAVHYRL